MESRKIKLTIEGLQEEKGHVRLSDLIKELRSFLRTLNAVDQAGSSDEKTSLYYRVIDVTNGCPLIFTLMAVVNKNIINKTTRRQVLRRPARLVKELEKIRERKDPSPDFEPKVLEQIRSMVKDQGRAFQRASIQVGNRKVELDRTLEDNVHRLIEMEQCSYGTIEGRLETVDLHGKHQFLIYPAIGPDRILCKFMPDHKSLVKGSLEKTVRVTGLKFYRPDSFHPYRIEVREIDVLYPTNRKAKLADLQGIAPNITGEKTAVDFVSELRDEW